jgi:hypothetical protein
LTDEIERDELFEKLWHVSREKYVDEDDVEAFLPELRDEWLEPEELQHRRAHPDSIHYDSPSDMPSEEPTTSPGGVSEGAASGDLPGQPGTTVSEGVPSATPRTALTTIMSLPVLALSAMSEWAQLPAMVSNYGSRNGSVFTKTNIKRSYVTELSLLQDDWTSLGDKIESGVSSFACYLSPDLSDDVGSYTVTDVQPHLLKAKAALHDADNPTLTQAMASPHQAEWTEAMRIELQTLEEELKAWTRGCTGDLAKFSNSSVAHETLGSAK